MRGGEDRIFDVDVDGVEDEDAGHLGPGVEGGDAAGEEDGDDAACDGDDVEQAHEDAEKDDVADVQDGEDDGAADAEDEHEQALAESHLLILVSAFWRVKLRRARGRGSKSERKYS